MIEELTTSIVDKDIQASLCLLNFFLGCNYCGKVGDVKDDMFDIQALFLQLLPLKESCQNYKTGQK